MGSLAKMGLCRKVIVVVDKRLFFMQIPGRECDRNAEYNSIIT